MINIFKERFKFLRKVHNLNQSKIGNVLKVSKQTISRWELGTREPSFETLIQIAKYFNVTTDYLLGLSDNLKNDNLPDK